MLLLELLSRLQNSNTSLLFWNLFTGLKFLNESNIGSSLSLRKFSIPLSHRICMTSYLFSLLMVTTHSLHLMLLWSNLHHHSKSLINPSDMLQLISGTSFLHHSEFLIQITHPLSVTFIWTCRFNLLHTAITFHHCFTLSSKPTFLENLILHLSLFLSVRLMAVDHLLDLFAHRFYVIVLFFLFYLFLSAAD